MERWDIKRRKLSIDKVMIESLTAGIVKICPRLAAMSLIDPGNDYLMSLSIGSKGYSVIRLRLNKIKMLAPFALDANIMYPVFDGVHPIAKLEWNVPPSMALYLGIYVDQNSCCIEQHLVAVDSTRQSWRLPISNLYADCRLCAGRFDGAGEDMIDLAKTCLDQFNNSPWNRDLYTDSTADAREKTRKMFSFTVEADKVTSNQPPSNWTSLCDKVSTEHITGNLLY